MYSVHTLGCMYGSAINSKSSITVFVMSPESGDPMGVSLIY